MKCPCIQFINPKIVERQAKPRSRPRLPPAAARKLPTS